MKHIIILWPCFNGCMYTINLWSAVEFLETVHLCVHQHCCLLKNLLENISIHSAKHPFPCFLIDSCHWNCFEWKYHYPDSKVHGANMGPIWGRQDPGGSHVGPMNLQCAGFLTNHSCQLIVASNAMWCLWSKSTLVQVIDELKLPYGQLDSWEKTSMKLKWKIIFLKENSFQHVSHIIQAIEQVSNHYLTNDG